jgi:hypothetical protein
MSALLLLSLTIFGLFKMERYISFSDSAKYADIAKNIVNGEGYLRSFTFFSGIKSDANFNLSWVADWPPPFVPISIAFMFKIFGISDLSIRLTTLLFFVLTIVFVYLLAKKHYGYTAGLLSLIAVGFNYDMLKYSLSGGTEIIFIFEIVLGYYLLSLNKRWSNFTVLIVSVLMYLTRPQYFIFCIGFLIYYLFRYFMFKKAVAILSLVALSWIFVDILFLSSGVNSYYYSVLEFAKYGLSSTNASDQLRGLGSNFSLSTVIVRLLYTLYNFYKALPDILNPYLFVFYCLAMIRLVISFVKRRLMDKDYFVASSLFSTLLLVFVTALTVPFYRYLHPVIPLVYVVSIGTLVSIVKSLTKGLSLENKSNYFEFFSFVLIIVFAVINTLGIVFLDSRSISLNRNFDKAPIYVEMSYKLKEITNKDMVIVTNLDTWGSWYGERKTIWFPVEPEMILPVSDNNEAIYLTSYKMDDENYYMTKKWREIFYDPENQTILPDYKFVGEYEFKAEDNYERENGRSVLLIKK